MTSRRPTAFGYCEKLWFESFSRSLESHFLAFTYIVGVEIRIVHFSRKRFCLSTRGKHLSISTVREVPGSIGDPL